MILVAALWTFPLVVVVDHDFSIVITDMAVIGFCVELRILNVVVDETHDLFECL